MAVFFLFLAMFKDTFSRNPSRKSWLISIMNFLENDHYCEEVNIYLNIGELKKESMYRIYSNKRPTSN